MKGQIKKVYVICKNNVHTPLPKTRVIELIMFLFAMKQCNICISLSRESTTVNGTFVIEL